MNNTPTDAEIHAAISVLERSYAADVRALADEWRKAKATAARIGVSFHPNQTLHSLAEASPRVRDPYRAKWGLLCTDNADAYKRPAPVETLALWALMADVVELLGSEFTQTNGVTGKPKL